MIELPAQSILIPPIRDHGVGGRIQVRNIEAQFDVPRYVEQMKRARVYPSAEYQFNAQQSEKQGSQVEGNDLKSLLDGHMTEHQ